MAVAGLSTSAAQGVYLPALSESIVRNLTRTLYQLARGQTNAKGTFTLNANATTTTVSNINCGPYSIPNWSPVTADAAAQMATLYCPSTNVTTGQFILVHASNTTTDQIFNYVVHS